MPAEELSELTLGKINNGIKHTNRCVAAFVAAHVVIYAHTHSNINSI